MQITVENIGKKFRKEWIFRYINATFEQGKSYAFVGRNGSGKSTLLQIIAGILPATEGNLTYKKLEKNIEIEQIYKEISFAAPYLELIEELTLQESIEFHRKFKVIPDTKNLIEILELEKHTHKPIKYFSSGMKQRLKLALAFYTAGDILILDEPTSNLDQNGMNWYLKHVEAVALQKIVLIGSNQPKEYDFCTEILPVEKYK